MAGQVRTLIITECRSIHTGRSSRGSEYTIYDLKATRADHTPLDDTLKLRSFQELALHRAARFMVEAFDSPEYGRSFTLTPMDDVGRAPSQATQIAELKERVARLEQDFEELALRVMGAASVGQRAEPTAVGAQPPPDAPPPAPAASPATTHTRTSDSSIPF